MNYHGGKLNCHGAKLNCHGGKLNYHGGNFSPRGNPERIFRELMGQVRGENPGELMFFVFSGVYSEGPKSVFYAYIKQPKHSAKVQNACFGQPRCGLSIFLSFRELGVPQVGEPCSKGYMGNFPLLARSLSQNPSGGLPKVV